QNSTVEFFLSDPTGAFQIDSNSGVVTVRNSTLLDRESVPSFSFIVFAKELYTSEKFRSDNASVLGNPVGCQRQQPAVSPRVQLHTSACPRPHPCGTVDRSGERHGHGLWAQRADKVQPDARLRQRTERDEPRPEHRGARTVGKFVHRQSTFVASYQLVATATDQAAEIKDRRSTSVIVQVTVISSRVWPPRVHQAAVCRQTSPRRRRLAPRPLTADPDTVLTYSLVSGSDKFSVASSANEGLVRVAALLDRETVDFYNLTAVVSDGTKTATAPVQIRLLDYNDNAPRFTSSGGFNFSVLENLPAAAPVGRVVATDADEPGSANAAIRYSLLGAQAAAYFSINSSTGEVFTSRTIDREATASFSFPVLASDGGIPQLSASVD
uniref:Cadherin domain-containing protein n=1 Tax=Macrostomum lignano TaxID=282301 RepID=A0A1I8H947_9PLAT